MLGVLGWVGQLPMARLPGGHDADPGRDGPRKGRPHVHDPDLHLFLDDREITVRQNLHRMPQTARRESTEPVLTATGPEEGSGLGYATTVRDGASGEYRIWYGNHGDAQVRHAVSADCRTWERRGRAMPAEEDWRCDNLAIVPRGKRLDPSLEGAALVGYAYGTGGLHVVASADGHALERHRPGILPGVGDRSSLTYDQLADEYLLISRRGGRGFPGCTEGEVARPRVANLWKSVDLISWEDCGIVLQADDRDPPDTQIYGMQPFRYGTGFLALVEVYHEQLERLDVQLAYSDDGIAWERLAARTPVLAAGGEGAFDSHWIVPTYNPPLPEGDRLLIPYSGACTKHASKGRHKRAVGLASIRKDGWVSLEAGRKEGFVVTKALPLNRPTVLEVNANCHSGWLRADVVPAAPGSTTEADAAAEPLTSRLEHVDSVCRRLAFDGSEVLEPTASGRCFLRFTLYQSSLFSYRWSEAGGR